VGEEEQRERPGTAGRGRTMARGPDGRLVPDEIDREAAGLNPIEFELASGLEKVLDGALAGFRGGGPFAYGIHQALSPRMKDVLARRYREAGWGDVRVTEGATGSCLLVLHRDPPPEG
jgi:hypothetical protein